MWGMDRKGFFNNSLSRLNSKSNLASNNQRSENMRFKQSVTFVFLVLLLGAGLLSFLAILGGARNTGVLRNLYWLEANTSGFGNAPATTRWYNYEWCGYEGGSAQDCSSRRPAQPFSPRDNFGASDAMPATFVNNRKTYYYLSRVAWAMLLVGLVFIVMAIVPLLATVFAASTWVASLSTVWLWSALFFVTLAACLYTGCYVKARNAFADNGRRAKLGSKNFAFIWTSVALLLICALWSTITTAVFGINKVRSNRRDSHGYDSYEGDKATTMDTYGDSDHPASSPTKFKYFKRIRRYQAPAAPPATMATNYDEENIPAAPR